MAAEKKLNPSEKLLVEGNPWGRVGDYFTRVEKVCEEPRKEADQRAIHDGWRIILSANGKKTRMKSRLERMTNDKYWVWDDTGGTAQGIARRYWNDIINKFAAYLLVELDGAADQYGTIRLVWRETTRFGASKGTNAPVGSAASNAAKNAASKKAAKEARAALVKRYNATMKRVQDAWNAQRNELRSLTADFADLIDDLQVCEEGWLRARIAKMPTAGATPAKTKKNKANIKMANTLLRDCAAFRRGTKKDVRKWNGARKKVWSKVSKIRLPKPGW